MPGSPRAPHSAVRLHPLPQPAPALSPPPPEASPAPSTPSLLFAGSLLSTQPILSQGTSRATCHTANWGGPLGGQPPGIGQLPAAPAPARLLFVTAASRLSWCPQGSWELSIQRLGQVMLRPPLLLLLHPLWVLRVTSPRVFPAKTLLQTSKPSNHRKTPNHKKDALQAYLLYLPFLRLINRILSKRWKDLGINQLQQFYLLEILAFPERNWGEGEK